MCRTFLVLTSLAVSVVSPVSAHHSPTAFEMSQVIAFEGTVTRFQWRNPHVYLSIEDREGVEWLIETDATPVLLRSGWTRDSFAVGNSVTVRARPHKDPEKTHGVLLTIEGPDGVAMASMNRVDLPQDPRTPASTTSIAGVWQAELLPVTSPVRVPLVWAFITHPLTEKGEAAKAAYDESMTPTVDCISYPTPIVVGLSALYLSEIELRDDVIVMRNEFYNTERSIYMDGRAHPENGERTLHGHSVGSWEGDTLVVDTRLFADHRSAYGVGIPSGAQKHVIERYALSDDGTQRLVDIFVEDPEYLAEPFTGNVVLNYSPHLEMLSLDCDPEVARRFTLD